MHRLGFFITPSPRHADVLLVVGPVTDHMKLRAEKGLRRHAHAQTGRGRRRVRAVRRRVRGKFRLRQRRGGRVAGGRGSARKSAAAAGDSARPARGGRTQSAGIARLAGNGVNGKCGASNRWKRKRSFSIFFALCGVGILLSLAAPASRQGNVLAWLGCLASVALVLAGASALLAGQHFQPAAMVVAGIGGNAHAENGPLSAVFIFVTGLVLFPASIFAGGRVGPRIASAARRAFTVFMFWDCMRPSP